MSLCFLLWCFAYFNKEDILINFLLYMYKVINRIDHNPELLCHSLSLKYRYNGALSDPYTSVFLSIFLFFWEGHSSLLIGYTYQWVLLHPATLQVNNSHIELVSLKYHWIVTGNIKPLDILISNCLFMYSWPRVSSVLQNNLRPSNFISEMNVIRYPI